MKKNTLTKLAALATVLLVSVGTIAGSTVAWFTDTEYAVNTIQSGELDIEWQYAAHDSAAYSPVPAENAIIGENANYEPGYTEVVKLKIINDGDLALRYKLEMTANNTVIGNSIVDDAPIYLSDHLLFAAAPADVTISDRAAAIKYVTDNGVAFADVSADTVDAEGNPQPITLVAGEAAEGEEPNGVPLGVGEADSEVATDGYTLILHMPTSVGNEANHNLVEYPDNKPTVKLGLNLIATQDTVEADSYDNQYDAAAEYPESVVPGEDDGTEENEPEQDGDSFSISALYSPTFDETTMSAAFSLSSQHDADVEAELLTNTTTFTVPAVVDDGLGYGSAVPYRSISAGAFDMLNGYEAKTIILSSQIMKIEYGAENMSTFPANVTIGIPADSALAQIECIDENGGPLVAVADGETQASFTINFGGTAEEWNKTDGISALFAEHGYYHTDSVPAGETAKGTYTLNVKASVDSTATEYKVFEVDEKPAEATNALTYDSTNGTILTGYTGSETNILLPDGIKTIATDAFTGTNVRTVWLPNSLETIEANAFTGSENLTIVIPEGVEDKNAATITKELGSDTIYCYANIGSQLKTIAADAFGTVDTENPTLLATFVYNGNNDSWWGYNFYAGDVTTVDDDGIEATSPDYYLALEKLFTENEGSYEFHLGSMIGLYGESGSEEVTE